ncbi:MAG: iron-containing redox enzyme family protein [Actinomycetota bacterium]
MEIDSIVTERHLLNHSFYQRWQQGKVTMEVLREYAIQYYAYESAFPSYLAAGIAHLEEGPARVALEQNLADETGNPAPHPELWLRFTDALGIAREVIEGAPLLARTSNLVNTYDALCRKGPEEALGALYAYEAQFSQIAETKADGLRRFYGITDEGALEFFEVHAEVDDGHAASLRIAMANSERTIESAHLALDAWWSMLDQFETMSDARRH